MLLQSSPTHELSLNIEVEALDYSVIAVEILEKIFQVNGDYCLECWQELTYPLA